MTPLISVIIPCYNQGAFVGEAVASVLAQTFQDFEILIVDDGSDDAATAELVTKAQWPRTVIVRTENQGLARARNFLIARARGTYLCALDADDKLHAEYFERTLGEFRRDPGLTFVSTRLQMFGLEDRVTPDSLACDLPTLLIDCPLFPAALVRRSAVVALGGYDQRLTPGNEDWDLWISLLEADHRGTILPDILFFYRRRAGSMCEICTRGQIRLDHMEILLQKHRHSFKRFLPQVLSSKESEIAGYVRRRVALMTEVDEVLLPTIERRRAELVRLRAVGNGTLVTPRSVPNPRDEYERSLAEIAALRSSRSWRITAPLRDAYSILLKIRERAGDGQ